MYLLHVFVHVDSFLFYKAVLLANTYPESLMFCNDFPMVIYFLQSIYNEVTPQHFLILEI